MSAPFCSWRGRCQSCICHSCSAKAGDSDVLQPLFNHRFEIRILSFAVLSFRILMKLRCKLSTAGQGSSWHVQQGNLHSLKVKKEGAQWAGVGQPLREASEWSSWHQACEGVWFCYAHMFICTYICVYMFLYVYMHMYSTVPKHRPEHWKSTTCQTAKAAHGMVLTWVNRYSPKYFLGMIQN